MLEDLSQASFLPMNLCLTLSTMQPIYGCSTDIDYLIFVRLDKGVIVYIADSMGVRDIYDTDGDAAISTKEPLAVLVR